jgi:ribonuclease PH
MARRKSQTTRIDGRQPGELRPVRITRGFTRTAPGSVLVETGRTRVLCTAMVEEAVPKWREGGGAGWLTAEYEMLPSCTPERKRRGRDGRIDGRVQEIQRLVGRCLRAVVDLSRLGERTIWVDCDVLEADGGTRTASITGAYVALVDAISSLQARGLLTESPVTDSVAAVSVGIVGGRALLDLCYEEDRGAEVDFNIVQTGRGKYVEIQGAAEGGTFTPAQMRAALSLAGRGIRLLQSMQASALAANARRKRN